MRVLAPTPSGSGSFTPGPLLSGIGGNQNDTQSSSPVKGGIVYADATPLWNQLAIGSTNQALVVASGLPAWTSLGVAQGAVGVTSYATGDILYASGASTLSKLAIGTAGQVLTVSGGLPSWAAASAGGWSRSGTVVSLTNIGDQVGIGTAAPGANTKVQIVGTGAGSLGALYVTVGDASSQFIVMDAGAGAAAYLTFRGNAPAAMAMGALFTAGSPTDYVFTNPSGDKMLSLNVSGRELRFFEPIGAGTNFVGFAAPATLAADTSYTWPNAYPGSNSIPLLSSTAGVLSWGQIGSSAIAIGAVTYAKIQNVTDQRLLGNATGGAAAPSEISADVGLSLGSSKLSLTTAPQALTDAATIATNAANFPPTFGIGRVTLGGNRTLGAPSNPTDGQRILYEIKQDATGSRTLAYNAVFEFSTDVPSPTLSTAPGTVDTILFCYNSSAAVWRCLAVNKGFSA